MSKKKPTRGGGKRPAADSKVAARKSGRSAGSADSGLVATPAPAVEPAASPLDTLAASLKTADGFYFAPSPPGIGGVRKPSKVESVTIGDGGGGSLLLRLAGGDPKAASAGATEGFSIRVPDPFERQASERTVRVRALARSAGAAPDSRGDRLFDQRGRELRLAMARRRTDLGYLRDGLQGAEDEGRPRRLHRPPAR